MAIASWARRMRVEADQLPDTLAALREAAANIRQVSEDLTTVAARLHQVTEALDAAGLEEATQIIRRSGEAMRVSAKGMQAAQESFVEINDAIVGNLSRLPGGEWLNAFRRQR